jgi:hypothetical protein
LFLFLFEFQFFGQQQILMFLDRATCCLTAGADSLPRGTFLVGGGIIFAIVIFHERSNNDDSYFGNVILWWVHQLLFASSFVSNMHLHLYPYSRACAMVNRGIA